MTEQSKATGPDSADPSMEEILASIRRILNEDESAPPQEAESEQEPEPEPAPVAVVASAAEPVAEAEDEDVLVLDRSMLVTVPDSRPDEPASTMPEELPSAFPAPPLADQAATAFAPAPSAMPPLYGEPALLAPETAAAAASSVDGLLRTLAASRSTQVYRGGPTIEDLVREEIRPLLKEWLDSHLPTLVERLVRAEIERVAGRAVS